MTDRQWIPTGEVRVGDQLAHKLSDTPWTYTTVTGWSDRLLETSGVTHRTFTVTDAPWWVRDDNMELTSDLAGETLVRNLGKYPEPESAPEPEPGGTPEPGPVTRVILTDDFYGYRMPVPSRLTGSLTASKDDKWAVLESIGIARRDDVSPLAAWRDAVADETGIPRAELDPALSRGFDTGFTPAYVRTFMFYLA